MKAIVATHELAAEENRRSMSIDARDRRSCRTGVFDPSYKILKVENAS